MEERVYKFCGYDYGTFQTREGDTRKYCNIYCLSEMQPREGTFCGGYRAEKLKCVAPEVFKGVEPEDNVVLGFDRYGRVIYIKVVEI